MTFDHELAKVTELYLVQRGISFKRQFTDEQLAQVQADLALAQASLSAKGEELFNQFLREGTK